MEKAIKTYGAALLIVVTLAMALFIAEIPVNIGGGVIAHAQSTGAGASGSASAGAGAGASPAQVPAKCNVLDGTVFINFFTCVGSSFSGFVSGVLVYISATFLDISGKLFDWTLYYTIIKFGSIVDTQVMSAINTAWSAFRDIANIVIIAMFVFVAIQTILGSHEYGARKMIARLLIVAVLINFSLLFTKLIIDASNFTAIQFYAATNLPSGDVDGTQAGQGQTAGIAQAFENYAGVSGFTDTYNAVVTMARQPNSAFGQALLFGVFVALLFCAAAVVFLYGTFLLLSRALLLIFLMLTSSIAFATYLIPGAAKGRFGWSKWWSSLLNSAILAPLLIVLIWVSLLVGQYFKVSQGSLGDLIANPTSTVNIAALFGYMLVIGLLFISFKTAASFSKEIGGFDYAAWAPALLAGRTIQGFGFLSNLAIGGPAAGIANQLKQRRDRSEEGSFSHGLYSFGTAQAEKIAKRDINPVRSALGGAITSTAGAKNLDAFFGPKGHGFDGMKHAASEAAARYGAAVGVSDERAKQMTAKAVDEVLKTNSAAAKEHHESGTEKERASQDLSRERDSLKSMQERHDNQMQAITKELRQAVQAAAQGQAGAAQQQQQLEVRKRQTEIEHQRQIQEQTQRIKEATQVSERANRIHERVLGKVEEIARKEGKIPNQFYNAKQTAERAAERSFSNALFKAAQLGMGDDHELAHHASEALKKSDTKKKLKESGFADVLKEVAKEESGGAAAPAQEHHEPRPPAAPQGNDHGGHH